MLFAIIVQLFILSFLITNLLRKERKQSKTNACANKTGKSKAELGVRVFSMKGGANKQKIIDHQTRLQLKTHSFFLKQNGRCFVESTQAFPIRRKSLRQLLTRKN